MDLVIKLEEWDRDKEYDRLGLHEEYTEYLGNKIVCHAAEELYKRVQANFAKKREEK